MIRLFLNFVTVRRFAQKPLHIRLTGDEPNFADENIL